MLNAAPEQENDASASWSVLGVASLLVLILVPFKGFSLDPSGLAAAAGFFGLFAAVGLGARRGTDKPRLAAAATAFQQMILFSCAGVMLSYLLAAQQGTLWDPMFRAWDEALGVDWPRLLGFVEARPWLALLTRVSYYSLIPQMIVLIVALAAWNRLRDLRLLVLGAIVSGLATILLSGAMPAAGMLFDPAAYPEIGPSAAYLHAADIAALRSGRLDVLDLLGMKGIVTFPSYHAALATIFLWGSVQLRGLRWPGALWSLLIMLATPVGGGHYVVDVIAGTALGAISLAAARAALKLHVPGRVPFPRWAPSAGGLQQG